MVKRKITSLTYVLIYLTKNILIFQIFLLPLQTVKTTEHENDKSTIKNVTQKPSLWRISEPNTRNNARKFLPSKNLQMYLYLHSMNGERSKTTILAPRHTLAHDPS